MKRKSKLLMIAVPLMIILLGAVIYRFAGLGVREALIDRENEIFIQAKTLENQMTLIADKPFIEARIALLREARKADNLNIIDGPTPSVVAAVIQDAVRGIIASRGGSISSELVEKPEDVGKFKMITVTIDALLPDTKALGDILLAIETQTTYLATREIDVRIRNFKEPRELTVRIKVSGLTGGR